MPERKRSTPINPANTIRRTHANNAVSQRPYRDRVIHLLALKTYKKPELLARLQRDGVNLKDRNSLTAVLQQVRSWLPAFFFIFFFFTPAILLVIILGCVLPYLNEKIINTLNNPLTVQVFQLTLCTCFKMQAKVREGKIKRYVGGSFVFLGWQAAINYFLLCCS